MRVTFSVQLKSIALITAFIFCFNQIVFAAGEILPREYQPNPNQPVVAATSVSPDLVGPTVKPATTTDFLSNEQSPLSSATQEVPETAPESFISPKISPYEYERYDFQDALDLLRPEFATAVIVKKITTEDLRKLAELPFEIGVIVLHGEIVLFTSGNENELGILPAASQLLEKATFVSHTHTGGSLVTGPSEFDLAHAGDEEYVITEAGVYAYDNTGLLNEGEVYSYGQYIERLNRKVKDSLGEKDQTEARKDLNAFIADQDLYNESVDRKVFRLAEPTTVVGTTYLASAITALSSTPASRASLGTTYVGQSANGTNNFVQYDSTKFSFEYSLPVEPETAIDADNVNDDFALGQISWGYFDSSNVFQGTAGNVGSPLVMALRADRVMRVKVEVVDTTGAKSQFWANLSTGYQNFSFDISALNESSVASVTVVSDVAQGGTSGKIYVITNGLSYTPVVAGTVYNLANISRFFASPVVSSSRGTTVASNTATVTATQTSSTIFNVNSQVNVAGEYTTSTI
ncbi:MAG: hypothetical protein V1882_06930, partial [Candidatus Omnitrophota bacterium]